MAIGARYAALDGSMRLPIALRLDAERLLAAELSLAQLSPQMRQTSPGGTVAYLATRGGTLLAQPESVELSAEERALLAGGLASRVLVRADGERLSRRGAGGDLSAGWWWWPARGRAAAATLVRQYTLFWVAVSLLPVLVLGALLAARD
jgi:hypothetical protein